MTPNAPAAAPPTGPHQRNGTLFTGRAVPGAVPSDEGLVTEVTGTAHRTGEHRFVLDPYDTLGTGFLL
ncbi:hypothetical protein ABZ135_26720 [Streptomyces sp. NPDC006339]|uniref:hypothetical protein n=1 Tax=Streptomyces sp. NPDC006339 TaxID=3156755 RepID=UPI0033BEBDC9